MGDERNDGQHEDEMDESARHVKCEKAEKPSREENDSDREQQVSLLSRAQQSACRDEVPPGELGPPSRKIQQIDP